MLKIIFNFAILLLIQVPQIALSQSFTSTFNYSFGSTKNDNILSTIVTANNSVLSIGYFNDTVDFDPDTNSYLLNAVGNSFLHKMGSSGNFEWVKQFRCSFRSMTIDKDENIYLVGDFSGSVDFDPDTTTHIISSTTNSRNGFILKLDSNANFVNVWKIPGYSNKLIDVAVDSKKNIFAIGDFSGSVNFSDFGVSSNLNSIGQTDCFILKIDSNGLLQWRNRYGSIKSERSESIAIDNDQNIVYAGNFSLNIDFDLSSGVFNLNGGYNGSYFMQKLNQTGDLIWAKVIPGTINNNSLKVDKFNNYIFAGSFYGSTFLNPNNPSNVTMSNGQVDAYITSLSLSGNFNWGYSFGGSVYDNITSIDVDTNANIIIGGVFQYSVDFDFDSINVFQLSSSNRSIYNLCVDKFGMFKWVRAFANNNFIKNSTVAFDNQMNIISGGNYRDTVFLDNSISNIKISNGDYDFFILKYQPNLITTSLKSKADQFSSIYPNPFRKVLNVDLIEPMTGIIRMYDFQGKIIKTQSLHNQISTNIVVDSPKGNYILVISTNKIEESHLVIIQ